MELTRTSANHLANIAKEAYQQEENILKNINFVTTSIGFLDKEHAKIIKEGKTFSFMQTIKDSLSKIAKYKYLIAYIREEIKSLDNEETIAKNCNLQSYELALGLQPLEPPVQFSVQQEKKSTKILKNEAYASVYGKFIHPLGDYTLARKHALETKENPIKVDYNGKDTIVSYYTPTVSLETIEEVFFDLQKSHRHYQSTLNKELFDKEQKELKEQELLDNQYNTALEEYWKLRDIRNAEFSEWKKNKLENIRLKKISIPEELIPIVEEIQKLM